MTQQEPIIFSAGHKANTANGICLDLSEQGLSACELDLASGKVLFLSEYKAENTIDASFISEGLKALQIQPKRYDKTFINYAGKKFTMVPTAFFDEKNARQLLEFNCGDTGSEIVLVDDVNAEIKLIYSIDESLKSTFDKFFPNHHLKHTATVLSKLTLQSDELNHEQILLTVSDSALFVTAKKDNTLLLCNQYQVQNDEDILYYVLFVLEQFELNPLLVKVSVAGQTATDSPLAKALKKYIKQVRFVSGNKNIKRDDIASLPHHYYYATLNRPFCE